MTETPDLEQPSSPSDPLEAPAATKPKFLPSRTALMIVDMQNDFLSAEGSMRIPGANKIVDKVKGWYKLAHFSKWPIIASMDWHPADHASFIPNGGSHPIHCIKGWRGAQLHPGLFIQPSHVYFSKKGETSTDDPQDAWGGWVTIKDTGVLKPHEILTNHKVVNLFITGVAAEYTIKETALRAVELGYKVLIPSDAVAGMHPAGVDRAFDELRVAGVQIL